MEQYNDPVQPSFQLLLSAHARSFTLTLRLLPKGLREPLSLGYLLARASDTIADASGIPREWRLELLQELDASFGEDDPGEWHPVIGAVENGTITPSEQELLDSIPAILLALDQLPERNMILFLWRTILQGQLFDLERFTLGAAPLTDQELEFYCGLVAGSVGNAWTGMIALHAPETLLLPKEEMAKLGISYGKGLQLLNILRDRAADHELGRIYIQQRDVPTLLDRTSSWLAEGERYCSCLKRGRIRYASELPLRLAQRTLKLIRNNSERDHVKIPRSEVYGVLVRALPSLIGIQSFPKSDIPAS